MRGTTDWLRYTLHLDNQRRAQALADVDNHKAVLRHLRAAMCPTTLMCTPGMWEALVRKESAGTAAGAITKIGGWQADPVAKHCIGSNKRTQPPSNEQTTRPRLRDHERVATAVSVSLDPPRARRITPNNILQYVNIETSLGETTQSPGKWQMTAKIKQGSVGRTTDRGRRPHPTQYLH